MFKIHYSLSQYYFEFINKDSKETFIETYGNKGELIMTDFGNGNEEYFCVEKEEFFDIIDNMIFLGFDMTIS